MKINLEVVFVILTLLFINVHGERSVAFVIDDSYSMNDEIKQVKMQTEQLFEAVFESDESKFNNYVLVTFNDPSSEVRIITNSSQQFKKYLSTNINLIGNLDCPEMAMLGILNALNSCQSNSVIYVFTDAAAKDYYRFEEVKSLSLKKSIQVTFLLTGICNDTSLTSEKYVAYFKLAEATSGQVFHLSESNIDKVIPYISESIKSQQYLLADRLATDCPILLSFDVDSKTSNVMISVSKIGEVIGSNKTAPSMSLQVLDSGNNFVKYNFIMNSKYIMIVKLHDLKSGLYKVKLDCSRDGLRTYMAVKGTTSISFVHGFSEDKPNSLEETSTLPLPKVLGDKTFLAIALDNPKRDVILDMIELIDVNNTIIQTAIAQGLVDAEKQFYVTEKINIPDKMFKIKVHGYTKSKEKVARLGNTFIEPQKSFGKITDKSPKVTIIGDIEIVTEPNTPVTLKCSVEAYPKPEIVWEKDNGDKFETEVITVDLTGHYKSVLQIKESNSATYYCIAKNTKGKAKAYAKITIIEKLPLIEDTKINVSSLKGNIIEIPCNVIEGYPPPSVEWFRNNIKINDRKYHILKDHTLKFRAEVSDNQVFTCVAKNNAGQCKKHTNITVYELPLIEDTKINVSSLKGNIIEIPCNVIEGYPPPSVEWFRNNIKINDRKYHILKDHTLKFRAEVSDNQVFTCVAKNNAGQCKKHTNITVYELPLIEDTKINVSSLKGNIIEIPCNVIEGYPPPSVEWFRNNIKINDRKYHILKDHTLKFRAEVSDNQVFTCVAKNNAGQCKKHTNITVYELPLIEDTKINVSSLKGNIIKIPCNVIEGYPPPSVEWFRNNIKINDRKYHILKDHTLKFRAEVSDNQVFTCVAKNNAGQCKKHTNITVYELPLIEDTKINVSSLKGNIIEIPCNVIEGYPPPSVEWFRNNIKINDRKYHILKDHTLKFRAEVSGNQVFTCVAKNNAGQCKKHTNITVYERPFIENSNKYVFTLKGRLTEIPCNVIKGYPPPSVEWFRKNISISSGRKYQILEDHTLRFRAEVSDHDFFVCNATNDYGYHIKKVYVDIHVKPAIKNTGKDVNIAAKKMVDLECLVTGFPKPEVRWFNNSEYIGSGSKAEIFRDHKLRFNATIFDTGDYTCEAINSVGGDKITFHVNVYEPAEVALPSNFKYEIELGTRLSLACSAANGYPTPKVELFRVPKDKKSRLSPLTLKNKTYKRKRAKRTDAGNYTCSAKNDYSLSSFTYTVEIQEKPHIDKTTSEYSAIEGDPFLVITCNASGNPKPSFSWLKDGLDVANPSETNDGTLVLDKPVQNMSGSYQCKATNKVGKDTHHVDVTILPYPELTPGPNDIKRPDVTLHEGIQSTVPCSNKPLRPIDHVRWYKGRKLISHEKILLINPSSRDNGKYICRVSNSTTSVSYYTQVVVAS